jgi:hypothetical protein
MLEAFALGMWEFRLTFTATFADKRSIAYDWGREWAHRLTLRRYDNC